MRSATRDLLRFGEARHLALVFTVVYFAQGMWGLPAQPITFVLKEHLGLFWTFSPSIGTPLFFDQTDTLQFSQSFIGMLSSLSSVVVIMGALAYAWMSRRTALKRMLQFAIGIGSRRHSRIYSTGMPSRPS